MARQPLSLDELPENFHEAYVLSITDQRLLLWLNILSIALLVPFVLLMAWWTGVVRDVRGIYLSPLEDAGSLTLVWWLAVILVLPLHELLHGVVIQWVGHRPRYGAKYSQFGPLSIPYVLFATADDALFRRGEFILVALAPVVVITLVGMALIFILPDFLGFYVGAAIVINGAGSIGDLWMTAVVLRYSSDVLVRDEEDQIRVYAPA